MYQNKRAALPEPEKCPPVSLLCLFVSSSLFCDATRRVFNRLWTKAYFMSDSKMARIQDRMNKGLEVKEKAFKSWEENPLEDNVTLLVTRATLKEYGNLAGQLAVARPDVLVTRVATRAVTMSSAPLKGYRERMCRAGLGPYRGLNVPSSGWVMGYMMLKLCDTMSIYGFGVGGRGDTRGDTLCRHYGCCIPVTCFFTAVSFAVVWTECMCS